MMMIMMNELLLMMLQDHTRSHTAGGSLVIRGNTVQKGRFTGLVQVISQKASSQRAQTGKEETFRGEPQKNSNLVPSPCYEKSENYDSTDQI